MKTKLTLLVTVLAAALFVGGCSGKADAIIEVHNQMAKIESAMVNQVNGARTSAGQAAAMKTAVGKMLAIDISKCPENYQAQWNDVIQLWKKLQQAYEDEDEGAVDNLLPQSPIKTGQLNKIAESHGVEINVP